MLQTLLLALVVFLLLAISPLAHAAQHAVTVGGPGGLKFDPEFVTAEAGDTVLFTFKQKNHTATQSSLANPCSLIDGGFDSGFVPVPVDNTDGPFPAAALTVTDTNPIWVFCAQVGHCSAGMIFAVNPADKFDAFKASAMGNSTSPLPSASSSGTAENATSTAISSEAAPSAISSTPFSSASISTTAAASATSSSIPTSQTQSATSSFVTLMSSGSLPPPVTDTPLSTSVSFRTSSSVSMPTSTSYASPPTQTSLDHHVVVGGPGLLAFSPPNVKAAPGDTITFQFRQTNHTATASSFDAPCQPLEGAGAFDSGFMAVAGDATKFPSFTIQVNDTTPIWVFCKQGNHCSSGMVFAVNAPVSDSTSNNFDAFLAKAKDTKTKGTGNSANSPSTSDSMRIKSSDAGPIIITALVAVLLR